MPHNFHENDRVRLNPDVGYFTYGRGGVEHDEVGTVVHINSVGSEVTVAFPSHGSWGGLVTEIVHANNVRCSKYKKNLEGIINLKPVSKIFG